MNEHDQLAREAERAQERTLMERIHAGDPAALDIVLQRYWSDLVSYANRLVTDRDAAEDVVQEAMLVLWRERTRWTPTSQLRGFLYQVTRNLALNELKKLRVRRAWAESPASEPDRRPANPLELTEQAELRAQLDRAVDELPARRREAFILARYHGHTYREIADIMEISPQTVANQISAALDELREKLRPLLAAHTGREHLRVIRGGGAGDPASDTPPDSAGPQAGAKQPSPRDTGR